MADEWETITPNTGEEKEVIEFEIEGEEDTAEATTEAAAPEIEVEEKAEQPVVEEEPEDPKEKEEKAEEEQALEGVETSGAQKRIRQLVKQKKEREEEITKLLEQNKQMQVALQQQQEEYRGAVGTNLANSEAQIVERLAVARDSYKRAIDSGDSDLILKAQEYLNNAQLDSTRIQDAKRQFEALTPAQQQQIETQAQAAQEPETYQGYDLKAYQWASKNEWFNSDPVLTNAALAIDAQLKEEGFDPREDEFYLEIDKRLSQTFPTKFDGAPAPVEQPPRSKATSQPSQVVAGASSAPKASSGKKVKLSQEDVRLAQKWGITLEQYAAEKLKIERVNDGEYTTVG